MIKLIKPIKVSRICKIFNLKFYGKDRNIIGLGSITNPKQNILCFSNFENKKKNKIIIQKNKNIYSYSTIIVNKNPRLIFCKILNYLLKKNKIESFKKKNDIHKTVKISNDSLVGENIKIEKNCIIEPGAKIFSNVTIKKNTIVRSGAIVGCYGFGFERDQRKKITKFPQFGSVFINENVLIGNNTCIVISTFDKTIIGENTKIDNLVHVAHNVKIGKNCIITAKCQIAGSVEIGNNVWLSPSSTIKNKIKLADNVFVGIGSVVIFDVKKNQRVFGNPAQPLIK